MAGNDLRTMNDSIKMIFTNENAIQINQDKLGIQGSKIFDEGDFEVWSKKLSNNETAYILFNRNFEQKTYQIDWKKLGVTRNKQMFDIWKNTIVGNTKTTSEFTIPGHSVFFYKLK